MRSFYSILALALVVACEKEQPGDPFVPYSWETITPLEAGMDKGLLDSALLVASGKGYVDGLLVIKDGRIVAEDYFNGFTKDVPHNIMSVSKSMLSAVAGLAIEGDYGLDLDDRMLDYFPEYNSDELDPRKQEITIRHLLAMQMGIDGESANNYGVYSGLYNSKNWIKSTIEYPLIQDPGRGMKYNTFITHLLSGVITKATGQSTNEFAFEQLFRHIGIDIDEWEQDPQGIYFGGNTMHVTPREMAVFGLLYMNNGFINGTQVIPRSWIEFSLRPTTNLDHPNEWGTWKNYNYASLWWLGQFNGQDCYMGYGYGGQFLIIFPNLDLIVISTCKNNVPPEVTDEQEWSVFELVTKYILPSLNVQ